MGLYQSMSSAMRNDDAAAYLELLHDDFQFVRHQNARH